MRERALVRDATRERRSAVRARARESRTHGRDTESRLRGRVRGRNRPVRVPLAGHRPPSSRPVSPAFYFRLPRLPFIIFSSAPTSPSCSTSDIGAICDTCPTPPTTSTGLRIGMLAVNANVVRIFHSLLPLHLLCSSHSSLYLSYRATQLICFFRSNTPLRRFVG